jgi:EAL domain-containing protein (putative c-di-GMP-specific phosphodiesterase class I)
VLNEACRQMSMWQKQYSIDPPLTIHINVSGKQFSDPRFFAQVRSALEQSGLNPNGLRLEISETAFIQTVAAAGDTLKQLDDLGVALQIDDFGTGYSSLAYLQHFPITTIKIDRSFISRIGSKAGSQDNSTADQAGDDRADNNDVEMIRTIMNLSRDLNMEAIAEGIETEEQFKLLKVLNCRYGQGFYFATPIDREAVDANLAKLYQ